MLVKFEALLNFNLRSKPCDEDVVLGFEPGTKMIFCGDVVMDNLQISAESIVQDAFETTINIRKDLEVKIANLEESKEFQGRKRTEYENALRKNYKNAKSWLNYANFEVLQHDMARARSLFERALTYNKDSIQLWARYVDVEIKNKSVNHARNVLERGIQMLPYEDKLWYQYLQLEEGLGNVAGAKSVFERWMIYEPASRVYDMYINLQQRAGDQDGVRRGFEQYVVVYPEEQTWIKWADYEDRYGDEISVRKVLGVAVDTLRKLGFSFEGVLIRWIAFEASKQELERCRQLFKFGLEKLELQARILDEYLRFEKKHGAIDDVLLVKRRHEYLEAVAQDPNDYVTWWQYITLLLELKDVVAVQEAFDKVCSHVPTDLHKSEKWKQYVQLWLRFLAFLEVDREDIEAARVAYKRLLSIVPHKLFTFSKVWIACAEFEIRQMDLAAARKLLGQSIGMCPKKKTFKYYIGLEKNLKEVDRVRKLYQAYLVKYPTLGHVFVEYAEYEGNLGDDDRSIGVFEIAIDEEIVKHDLLVWYAYINYLAEELYMFSRARNVFERMVKMSPGQLKVWVKWAIFEVQAPSDEQEKDILAAQESEQDTEIEIVASAESRSRARAVFERALKQFKSSDEERVLILEAYKQFEDVYGDVASAEKVAQRLPAITKKEGSDEVEYKFPDDANKSMKTFLENARKWKLQNKEV